ncbi:MAG: sulfotransferase [Hyphococcus sp.]|nr:MAG: sulfotransferase [Marinicaulis sp.]
MSNIPPPPDFIIIGAMKCGTSTLYEQLAAQPGFFMTTPKEPNFFSDDDIFSRGMSWYNALFESAAAGDVKGEASTHYTKLSTHPHAAERLHEALPDVKLIYLMRHPVDRLVSHYIHEWTMGAVTNEIDDVANAGSAFVDYGLYSRQLTPYLERYGSNNILPMFLERMNEAPGEELARAASFLEYERPVRWCDDLGPQNVSKDRIRRFPLYDLLVESAPATALRRAVAPRALRDFIKGKLQMRDRPTLSSDAQQRVERIFNEDLLQLGDMLGVKLTCANFKEAVRGRSLDWPLRT